MNYVITSAPRSATGYIAKVLNDIGLNCTHERKINQRKLETYHKEFSGESSWFAAPFLDHLQGSTVVLHQLRNPIETVNSCLINDGGRFREYPYVKERGYHRYAYDHTTRNGWVKKGDLEAAIKNEQNWWVQWHDMIAWWGERNPKRYFRYRVEDLNLELLHDIIEFINPPLELYTQAIVNSKAVLKETSKKTNGSSHKNYIDKNTATAELRKMMVKFGY